MTPPIDVMEVAALRYGEARGNLLSIQQMQNMPFATASSQMAHWRLWEAEDDMRRAQLVALYLSGYHSTGLQPDSGLYGRPIRSWADV